MKYESMYCDFCCLLSNIIPLITLRRCMHSYDSCLLVVVALVLVSVSGCHMHRWWSLLSLYCCCHCPIFSLTMAPRWAFGILMYFTLYGRYPFDGNNVREILLTVLHGTIDWESDVFGLDWEVGDLIGVMVCHVFSLPEVGWVWCVCSQFPETRELRICDFSNEYIAIVMTVWVCAEFTIVAMFFVSMTDE